MRARRISNLVSVFNSAFPVLAWAVIFYSATALMETPDTPLLTTGEFLAFMAAFVQFSTGALALTAALISVLGVVPLYERARPILMSLPEVLTTQTAPPELTGKIDIHHVSFVIKKTGPWSCAMSRWVFPRVSSWLLSALRGAGNQPYSACSWVLRHPARAPFITTGRICPIWMCRQCEDKLGWSFKMPGS